MKDPSKLNFDLAIAEEICERLATSNDGLAKVLRDLRTEGRANVPSERVVYYWRAHRPDFKDAYKEAREMQGELAFDEACRVAQTPNMSQIVTTEKRDSKDKGDAKGPTVKSVRVVDNVERSKLICNSLWQRARVFNRDLAESLNLAGVPGRPIEHKVDTDAIIERIVKNRVAPPEPAGK